MYDIGLVPKYAALSSFMLLLEDNVWYLESSIAGEGGGASFFNDWVPDVGVDVTSHCAG